MKYSILFLLGIVASAFSIQAQDFHMPKASPAATIHQEFSTSFIEVVYSRPSLRGRQIFGEQVPYGTVWRTGANESTKITLGEDLNIAGKPLKAGEYELYTIPNKKEWTIIFNKKKGNWGANGYSDEDNVLRVEIPVEEVPNYRETFEIAVQDLNEEDSCNLVLSWANLRIVIPIKADNNQRILNHLDQELKGDQPPYFGAAVYYLNTDQKLDKALEYVNIAIEQNPKAYFMVWQQAQILQKLGRHEEAVAAAKKAAELAKDQPAFADEYEGHYQQMLRMK